MVLEAMNEIGFFNFEGGVLAGTGELKDSIIARYPELTTTWKFDVVDGGVEVVANALKRAGIYISASKSDGTSVTLLEALSAGAIVIVSNFPSNVEWVKDGDNGFVFENQSKESLKETILKVLSLNVARLSQIKNSAKRSVALNGNWEVNRGKLLKFIEEL